MSQNFEIRKSTLIIVLVALIAVSAAAYVMLANPFSDSGYSNSGSFCNFEPAGAQQTPGGSTGGSAQAGGNPGTVALSQGGDVQQISIRALSSGQYDRPEIRVKAGIPVRLTFTADSGAGCGKYMEISEFGVQLISRNGEEAVAEFTPKTPGTYYYHCGMWMFKGKLVVE